MRSGKRRSILWFSTARMRRSRSRSIGPVEGILHVFGRQMQGPAMIQCRAPASPTIHSAAPADCGQPDNPATYPSALVPEWAHPNRAAPANVQGLQMVADDDIAIFFDQRGFAPLLIKRKGSRSRTFK
ncbi:MAG: hypothetical protein CM15mP21_1010 [Hyphomicrobiales bacterium]|nr:MAG: hypothetical protein CM15mP21_1010 [Hyphomicrobiales bacterium]